MKPMIVAGAVAAAMLTSGGLIAQGLNVGCPYPISSQYECYDAGPPVCQRKIVLRNCSGPLTSPLCCDPEDTIMEAVCCGEETYSAGVAGPCPDGGGAKCTYGATVVNPESGKVVRACAGAQLPHLKTGNVPERKGTS